MGERRAVARVAEAGGADTVARAGGDVRAGVRGDERGTGGVRARGVALRARLLHLGSVDAVARVVPIALPGGEVEVVHLSVPGATGLPVRRERRGEAFLGDPEHGRVLVGADAEPTRVLHDLLVRGHVVRASLLQHLLVRARHGVARVQEGDRADGIVRSGEAARERRRRRMGRRGDHRHGARRCAGRGGHTCRYAKSHQTVDSPGEQQRSPPRKQNRSDRPGLLGPAGFPAAAPQAEGECATRALDGRSEAIPIRASEAARLRDPRMFLSRRRRRRSA